MPAGENPKDQPLHDTKQFRRYVKYFPPQLLELSVMSAKLIEKGIASEEEEAQLEAVLEDIMRIKDDVLDDLAFKDPRTSLDDIFHTFGGYLLDSKLNAKNVFAKRAFAKINNLINGLEISAEPGSDDAIEFFREWHRKCSRDCLSSDNS